MRMLFLAALLGVASAGTTKAADFSFGRPVHLTLVRENAGSVAIGDVNGDGRMDLAVMEDTSAEEHSLSLFVQQADGSLSAPIKAPLPSDFGWAFPVSVADLDKDGMAEILAGMPSQLLVLRFAGGALTTSVKRVPQGGCAYIVTGDIDADGKLDVVCHTDLGTPTSASIFYGNGTGGFRPAQVDMLTDVGSYGSDPDFRSIQLADVTGDGRPDLLVTTTKISSFFVYPNNGVGFSTGIAYAHPPSPKGTYPAALQVLDIDGDGINEVVTASPDRSPDAALNIYRQGGDGTLVLSERMPIYDFATALATADVDGDGDKELLAGHYDFNATTLFGVGAVGLASQARYDLPGFGNDVEIYRLVGSSNALALGDLNGDGCIDLAGATNSGVTLLYGCRPFVNQVPVNDFDGDGVSDLIWRMVATGENFLWQWADANAWLGCAYPCPTSMGGDWEAQATGDFNGDGNSDMFWRNHRTGQDLILRSAFYKSAAKGVSNQDWQAQGAGDFDGDDHSDLVWRNLRNGAIAIWKRGDWAQQQSTPSVTDLNWKIVGIGDFDGDRRSDIFWRHSTSGRNAIWLSGRHDVQKVVAAVTNVQWRVRGIGDFNGDGRDDVVWRNKSTGEDAIWLSANQKTQQVMTRVTNQDWDVVAVGDYNGDGRSDVMWHNSKTGDNVIWRSARFTNKQTVAPSNPQLRLIP